MAVTLVALVLGAGPRIGTSVAKKFASIGYKVAVVSRSGSEGGNTAEGFLSLKADFTNPDSIPAIFDQVTTQFEAAPSVVVYNAAVRTVPPTPDDMFSITAATLAEDLAVNTLSPFIAAQQAISGWSTLPEDTKKAFIYTGNILNVKTLPSAGTLALGMGKSASSFWISLADALHSARGYR
jgi:NAD(P)-dependent dehydrogenase (short-subunit alcohol dehydrogenase family)